MAADSSKYGIWNMPQLCKPSHATQARKKAIEGMVKRERTHIHNTTVDISKLLETEQACGMSRIIERIALRQSVKAIEYADCSLAHGGGIDWDSSCVGSRIWFLAGHWSALSSGFDQLIEGYYLPSMKLQSIEVGRHCERLWCFLLWLGFELCRGSLRGFIEEEKVGWWKS